MLRRRRIRKRVLQRVGQGESRQTNFELSYHFRAEVPKVLQKTSRGLRDCYVKAKGLLEPEAAYFLRNLSGTADFYSSQNYFWDEFFILSRLSHNAC